MFSFRNHGSNFVDEDLERDHDREANPSRDQGGERGASISTRDLKTTRLAPLPRFSHTAFPIFYIRFAWLACYMFSATSNAIVLDNIAIQFTEPLNVVGVAF